MKSERRIADRYCFDLHLQPEGDLNLIIGTLSLEVWKLVDISPFGAGLSIDKQLEPGSVVLLQYQCERNDIKTLATVAWSEAENSQEEGAGFRLGLRFHKDKMPLNVSLFKALTAPAEAFA